MTTTLTVGELARLVGASEKAIRLYSDRGLLEPERASTAAPRRYSADQVSRARQVVLLRSLDLSLADVRAVLDDVEPQRAFDALWGARRETERERGLAAQHVRSQVGADAGSPLPVPGRRTVPERTVVSTSGTTTLTGLPDLLPRLTSLVFAHLMTHDVPVTDALFVAHHERSTEGFPARVTLSVPVAGPVPPAAGIRVEVDPAHDEVYLPVRRSEAASQAYLVSVHDRLRAAVADGGLPIAGDSREVYYREPARPGPDDVMLDVVIPVRVPVTVEDAPIR